MTTARPTLIFDLDGTLLDTLPSLLTSINHAMATHGYPLCSRQQVRAALGNGIEQLVRQCEPSHLTPSQHTALFETFRTHYADHCDIGTAPYAGILDLLATLHTEGYAMAIVTNKVDAAAQQLHEQYFAPSVAFTIGEREGMPRKPAPDGVHLAMQLLNATPQHTIYIGDSEVDLATARNAGLHCISLTWGFRDEHELIAHGATTIAHTTEELHHAITIHFNH
ncbi:MAG: HAD family hydrolase [Bacteroidales bacterium]|nr:HAD family hydrolase [Bacteroidales bacterium]